MADLKWFTRMYEQNSGRDAECARIPDSFRKTADETCRDYKLMVSHSCVCVSEYYVLIIVLDSPILQAQKIAALDPWRPWAEPPDSGLGTDLEPR